MNVLVTYHTKTSTTKEFAEHIANSLYQRGLNVECLPMSGVISLSNYDAYILGAPINGMQWTPEATNFVNIHLNELRSKPFASFFTSYLIDNCRPTFQKAIKESLKKATHDLPLLAEGYFKGRIDKPFPAPLRLLFGAKKDMPLDRRDWQLVDSFVDEVFNGLQTARVSSSTL